MSFGYDDRGASTTAEVCTTASDACCNGRCAGTAGLARGKEFLKAPLTVLCLGTVSRDCETSFSASGRVCPTGTAVNPHKRFASLLLRNLGFRGLGDFGCLSSAIML